MRLLSITVRNYRIHREITVSLNAARNLIGGPNECGKSTLAEAAHRALFLRARVTGAARDGMASTLHAGAPEVEVCFQKHGSEYRLTKVFRGQSGSCLLKELTGGGAWQGEEAEERLAALLGVDPAAGGRGAGDRAAKQWAHLWVWQGEGGNDPAEHANTQKDALLERLQTGRATAVLSARDAAAAGYFKTLHDGLFTKGGVPRKDTPWGRAREDFEKASADLAAARSEHERLRQAAMDWERADARAAGAEICLTELKRQSADNGRRLEEAGKLRQSLERQTSAERTAGEAWESLRGANEQIVRLRTETAERRRELETSRLETLRLEEEAEESRRNAALAEIAWNVAQAEARGARLRHDLAAAQTAVFESREAHEALAAKRAEVDGRREELNRLMKSRAELPVVDQAKLADLRKRETAVSVAEAELRGMAAGLEVVRADAPVRVDDETLTPGETRLLREETVVRIGDNVELRLRPGGGAGLAAARQRALEAAAELRRALDSAGVSSVAEAAEIQRRRDETKAEMAKVEAVLKGMGADRLERELEMAAVASRAAEAEVSRRLTALENAGLARGPAPENPGEARRLKEESGAASQRAEIQETEAAALRAATGETWRRALSLADEKKSELQNQRERLAGAEAQVRLLEETHGDEAARAARLAELWQSLAEARAELERTRNALEALQPELLTRDRERLNRALEQTEHERREAEKLRAATRALLTSGGGAADPREALALAEAAEEAARERLERERRKAEAARLLHTLFLEEQRALAEEFARPLADRISGYLQCVFGPGARAEVTLEDGNFAELKFVRPEGGAFVFSALSGGTREQVAAAMRLAMAELLAADHGGCLPVVFDDAFTAADPDRVQTLQRMLDLAAARGLQIIVLTCNPADYAALGAEVIFLTSNSAASNASAKVPNIGLEARDRLSAESPG